MKFPLHLLVAAGEMRRPDYVLQRLEMARAAFAPECLPPPAAEKLHFHYAPSLDAALERLPDVHGVLLDAFLPSVPYALPDVTSGQILVRAALGRGLPVVWGAESDLRDFPHWELHRARGQELNLDLFQFPGFGDDRRQWRLMLLGVLSLLSRLDDAFGGPSIRIDERGIWMIEPWPGWEEQWKAKEEAVRRLHDWVLRYISAGRRDCRSSAYRDDPWMDEAAAFLRSAMEL